MGCGQRTGSGQAGRQVGRAGSSQAGGQVGGWAGSRRQPGRCAGGRAGGQGAGSRKWAACSRQRGGTGMHLGHGQQLLHDVRVYLLPRVVCKLVVHIAAVAGEHEDRLGPRQP